MLWRQCKWKKVVLNDEKLLYYYLRTIISKPKLCLMNLLTLFLYPKPNKEIRL